MPFFIIFNLLFGLFFLKFTHWLLLEIILVLLFRLTSRITARKIISGASGQRRRHRGDDIIDVEAEVVDEKKDRGKLVN